MDKPLQVTFLRENRTVATAPGEKLLEVMNREGILVDAPCGGRGKCGKCRVRLGDGSQVLACQTAVSADLTVDTAASMLQTAQVLTGSDLGAEGQTHFAPAVRVRQVYVRPCPKGESLSDWARFLEDLGEACSPEPAVLSDIGSIARHGDGHVWAVLCDGWVLSVSAEKPACYMAAFDIGTTTVAGYLLDVETGQQLATSSCMNPQAQYGADVINRANYTLSHGLEEVTGCIREAVNHLLEEMAEKSGLSVSDIYAVSVAGNTCMHHLFLGIQVESLVLSPYNPVIAEGLTLRASDCALRIHPLGRLFLLPNIAGFVGADTVACLVSTRLAEEEDWTLLIDIGTNGEMVLGRQHQMAACSTAAGPAFEGAGITCGMRGSPGAISRARWTDQGWEFSTVGDEKPRGICGSGLLDLVAELLRSGQMDETGELQESSSILLADEAQSAEGVRVTLEQKDIRQLQLAKSAIASGIQLLAQKMGIDLEDISQVWLAGAFGSFLSPDSACAIGLIPPALKGKIRAIGNAAGEGAKQVLLDASLWDYAAHIAREADFLELATMPQFQDMFVDELGFPEQE